MQQIRIHGRGGQGVVTAAELIAIAAFEDGKYAQAFPHFGVERSGAPIRSYARIDNQPILTREQVQLPDILIIQDATLLTEDEIYVGVNKNTIIIINAADNLKLPKKLLTKNVFFSPATKIALEIFGKNIVNTVILGTFAKHTKIINLDSLNKAIAIKFKDKGPEIIAKNIKAVAKAFQV